MINYQKLAEIMCWEIEAAQGETAQDVFIREVGNPAAVPHKDIVDVVHAGGIEEWAKTKAYKTKEELSSAIMRLMRITINSRCLFDSKLKDTFPPLRNFHTYCHRLDCNGNLAKEAYKLTESVWHGELARKRLEERTNEMFSNTPDKSKYLEASEQIKKIWGFSDKEVDAFRYFVCQTRHKNHNPSMNKAIYLWAATKQSGKTTLARTIVGILNGETSIEEAGKYESTLSQELQYGSFDIPKAANSNATILDESMPRDSRKSYGNIKSMLTSQSITLNIKYAQPVHVDAKRFYFITSNEDISDFIQDHTERRFISIELSDIPTQISFEKIFEIWKQFATNCIPESDWQLWYNSFEHVEGLRAKDIEYFKAKLLTTPQILVDLQQMNVAHVSTGFFHDRLILGKSSRDERAAVKDAVIEVIGEEDHPSKWNRLNAIEKINNAIDYFGGRDETENPF